MLKASGRRIGSKREAEEQEGIHFLMASIVSLSLSIEKKILTGVGLPPSSLGSSLERLCGREEKGEGSLQGLERGEGLFRRGGLGHRREKRGEREYTKKAEKSGCRRVSVVFGNHNFRFFFRTHSARRKKEKPKTKQMNRLVPLLLALAAALLASSVAAASVCRFVFRGRKRRERERESNEAENEAERKKQKKRRRLTRDEK